MSRGLLGGDRRWMAVFAALGLAKLMRRFSGRDAKPVYCEELKPGEKLVIEHLPG